MTNPTLAEHRLPSLLPRRARGLSLVELLVALALGLVLVIGVASVYLFTKTAFSRQSQISSIQQSVRTAFEYLGNDARMIGHLGCATGDAASLQSDLSVTSLAENFVVGIEGYENVGGNAYTLSSDNQADVTADSGWSQTSSAAEPTLPIATLGGALSPGSDVLVIRTVATSKPTRLTFATIAAGDSIQIEQVTGGSCNDGTAKVSGFCPGSFGLVASCGAARAFRVNSIAGSTITPVAIAGSSYPVFTPATAEVFPLQTIVYYVKRSSSGTTTSLYRRVFTGDNTDPAVDSIEQELIEDVESLQLRYGRDTSADPDGIIDDYVTANSVTDWRNVVTVRMSLLMRSATPVPGDTKLAASAPVNGVTVTFPSGTRYDRRVFTTTVALRNKIAYF